MPTKNMIATLLTTSEAYAGNMRAWRLTLVHVAHAATQLRTNKNAQE